MFLHSGASLHGHEYSNRPPGLHPQLPGQRRRTPLLRSAFAHPPSHSSLSTSASGSIPAAASPPTVLPASSSATTRGFFTPTTTSSSASSPSATFCPSPSPLSRSSSVTQATRPARYSRRPAHQRHTSESPLESKRTPEPVVRFQDPVVAPMPTPRSPTPSKAPTAGPNRPVADLVSEDDSTFSASEASYASDQASVSATSSKPKRQRRAPRKSTSYLLAHPAPKLRTKKQLLSRIRPTLLMQLQLLSPDSRPLPVIDVYPSSLIAGDVVAPRFSRRFPRLFGVNGELGLHDTLLVRSDYDSQSPASDSDGDDDGFEHRSLLAVFSPVRRENRSEIVLEDGSVWTTSRLPTGSYDFVRVDEQGNTTTVRWVRRSSVKSTAVSAASALTATAALAGQEPAASAAEPECKFTFSIIDPQSRRHPILATLRPTSLDILDHYTTVSPNSGRYPPSRSRQTSHTPIGFAHDGEASNEEETHDEQEVSGRRQRALLSSPTAVSTATKERTTRSVDSALKDLISITGIWVVLQHGWAQAVATNSTLACKNGTKDRSTSVSSVKRSSSKRVSWPQGSQRSDKAPSPEQLSSATGSAAASTNGASGGGSGATGANNSSGINATTEPADHRGLSLRHIMKGRHSLSMPFEGQGQLEKQIAMDSQSSDRHQQLDHGPERDQSPSTASGMGRQRQAFPRKASSTGAAFMQRRMHMQMSDTSDSERTSFTGLRKGRTFARFSGDFSPSTSQRRQSQSQSPPSDSETKRDSKWTDGSAGLSKASLATPVSALDSPSIRTAPLLPSTASAWPRSGRSASAYYATNPLSGELGAANDSRTGSGTLSDSEQGVLNGSLWHSGPDSMTKQGSPNKWKRLGNWFKRLGGH